MTFTYTIIVTLAGFIACVIAILSNDRVGRVPLCMLSTALATMFNCLVATLGPRNDLTPVQENTVIASIIMVNFSAKLGISSQVGSISLLTRPDRRNMLTGKKVLYHRR